MPCLNASPKTICGCNRDQHQRRYALTVDDDEIGRQGDTVLRQDTFDDRKFGATFQDVSVQLQTLTKNEFDPGVVDIEGVGIVEINGLTPLVVGLTKSFSS